MVPLTWANSRLSEHGCGHYDQDDVRVVANNTKFHLSIKLFWFIITCSSNVTPQLCRKECLHDRFRLETTAFGCRLKMWDDCIIVPMTMWCELAVSFNVPSSSVTLKPLLSMGTSTNMVHIASWWDALNVQPFCFVCNCAAHTSALVKRRTRLIVKDVNCNTVCFLDSFSVHLEPRRVRVCQSEAFTTQDHNRCKCSVSNICEWNKSVGMMGIVMSWLAQTGIWCVDSHGFCLSLFSNGWSFLLLCNDYCFVFGVVSGHGLRRSGVRLLLTELIFTPPGINRTLSAGQSFCQTRVLDNAQSKAAIEVYRSADMPRVTRSPKKPPWLSSLHSDPSTCFIYRTRLVPKQNSVIPNRFSICVYRLCTCLWVPHPCPTTGTKLRYSVSCWQLSTKCQWKSDKVFNARIVRYCVASNGGFPNVDPKPQNVGQHCERSAWFAQDV